MIGNFSDLASMPYFLETKRIVRRISSSPESVQRKPRVPCSCLIPARYVLRDEIETSIAVLRIHAASHTLSTGNGGPAPYTSRKRAYWRAAHPYVDAVVGITWSRTHHCVKPRRPRGSLIHNRMGSNYTR